MWTLGFPGFDGNRFRASESFSKLCVLVWEAPNAGTISFIALWSVCRWDLAFENNFIMSVVRQQYLCQKHRAARIPMLRSDIAVAYSMIVYPRSLTLPYHRGPCNVSFCTLVFLLFAPLQSDPLTLNLKTYSPLK